jgi:hypothetical protein
MRLKQDWEQSVDAPQSPILWMGSSRPVIDQRNPTVSCQQIIYDNRK